MTLIGTHTPDKNTYKKYTCTICDFTTYSEKKARKHQYKERHFVDVMWVCGKRNRKI